MYEKTAGEHLYTVSEDERNALVKSGWIYEGYAWKCPQKNGSPVYRLYNPNTGDHFYTKEKAECGLLAKSGWKNEGTCFYASKEKKYPVYRLYNPKKKAGNHLFTLSRSECDALIRSGWKYEGIAWYAADGTVPEADTESVMKKYRPEYTYSDLDATMYAAASLVVRDRPSIHGARIGSLNYGQAVHVSGRCVKTGWYRLDSGFASDKYLIGRKPSQKSGNPHYAWSTSGSSQANINAGQMVEWGPDYYAADIRSRYYSGIRSLNPEDTITINGRTIRIDGTVYGNYKTDTIESIRAKTGSSSSVCIQTCLPSGGGNIMVKYGHYV